MFKLFYNRKGFTVVELIVAITITSIVLAAFGFAFYSLQETYNNSIFRSRVTSAMQLATQKLDSGVESLPNSKQVDVLYDPIVAEGIVFTENDNGTYSISWKSTANGGKPYVLPKENDSDHGDKYTYIFSTPAYDETGKELGYFLFIRNSEYDAETVAKSKLFLDDEGSGEVPVKVEFGIATDYIPAQGEWGKETTTPDSTSYTTNCLTVTVKSGDEENAKVKELKTKYALISLYRNKKINYDMSQPSKMVMEQGWVSGETAMAYPCGWSDGKIGNFPSKTSVENAGVITSGYYAYYQNEGGTVSRTVELKEDQNSKTGNVLRILSPHSDLSDDEAIHSDSKSSAGRSPLE